MQQEGQTEISTLGEFGLIDRITQALPTFHESTVLGVGDDCAIVQPTAGMQTVITTDMLMEGIHFDLVYTPLKHLGYKAVAVNLSDVYAMNATPRQLTISLAIGRNFSIEMVEELYAGMRYAAERYGVDIVGGDTTSSLTGLAISITCVGEAEAEAIVRRSGAKDTDLICVSGNLGAAFMGLQLLEREKAVFNATKNPTPEQAMPDFAGREYILERQLRPEPRADVVAALREAGIRPTAMIDISDGLSSELMHLCKQSNTGCRIFEERIPLDYQTAAMAEELNLNVTTCALNGGEDYELLFTVPLTEHERVAALEDVRVIGHMTRAELGLVLETRDSNELELKAQGWNPL